jgi:hypothetical protein
MKKKLLFIVFAMSIAGCATSPDKIETSYVSPLQYRDYDCDQIAGELERVTRRANELYGTLKKTADNDAIQMGVGLVLFWPTLFFLEGGDSPQAAEFARLKGERDTLEKLAIEKKCDPSIIPKPIVTKKDSEKEESEDKSTTQDGVSK